MIQIIPRFRGELVDMHEKIFDVQRGEERERAVIRQFFHLIGNFASPRWNKAAVAIGR